jgi:ABC-type multidrug transport system ATPase subunit
VIELRGVSFGYTSPSDVLEEVSLTLEPGLTLLLGPNGCGKSTLLKIAAGVERPLRGLVRVDGHDMWQDEVAARRGLAFLPEHPDLTPYASLDDVLALVCSLRGEPIAEAGAALEWVGLQGLGRRTVRELSKGQRRRATLAAARIGCPECVLLDEPLDGMDRASRDRLIGWVEERLGAGALALVATQEYEALAALAARAVTVRHRRCEVVEPLPAAGPERDAVLERLARGDAKDERASRGRRGPTGKEQSHQ